jgi:hypothetical protein
MLVLSRIFYGMLLGLLLILVSELCLANQDDKEFSVDKLTVGLENPTLYEMTEKVSVIGAYRHYDGPEVEADRAFLGLKMKF